MNQDDLVNLHDLLQGLEIDLLSFGYVHFSSEQLQRSTDELLGDGGRHLKTALLDPEVLAVNRSTLASQVRLLRERASRNRLPVRFVPDLTADEMSSYFSGHPYTYATRCFFPWFSTRVNPWGDVYPCWLDVRMGNVREAPLAELWNGAAYRRFRNQVRRWGLLPKCSTCCVLNDKLWSRLPGPLLLGRRLDRREARTGAPQPGHPERSERSALEEQGSDRSRTGAVRRRKESIALEDFRRRAT
jgi:MoaA/NifB/PqqE/SkfB family radical SAM enzyme